MPGRTYSAGTGYRYGFNGKENDDEVKGQGGEQDYGMRVYDPRIGKFLSVDPLSSKYPWNSSYAFAENDVIRCIDLDGAEKLGYLKPFETNGSLTDNPVENVPNAIGNVFVDALNLVPTFWNSAVDNYQALKRGTWTKDISAEIKQRYNNFGKAVYDNINYTFQTPITQQAKDFGKTLNDPQTLTTVASMWLWSKIPFPGKGNLLGLETKETIFKATTNELRTVAPALRFDPFELRRATAYGQTLYTYEGESLGFYKYSEAAGVQMELNIPSKFQDLGLGTVIFRQAITFTNATKFTATWVKSSIYETGASINLTRFQAALARGLSEEQAAWQTWSGQRALENGFKNVVVKRIENGVQATFTK